MLGMPHVADGCGQLRKQMKHRANTPSTHRTPEKFSLTTLQAQQFTKAMWKVLLRLWVCGGGPLFARISFASETARNYPQPWAIWTPHPYLQGKPQKASVWAPLPLLAYHVFWVLALGDTPMWRLMCWNSCSAGNESRISFDMLKIPS